MSLNRSPHPENKMEEEKLSKKKSHFHLKNPALFAFSMVYPFLDRFLLVGMTSYPALP